MGVVSSASRGTGYEQVRMGKERDMAGLHEDHLWQEG
jgi:hypothetical protein